jgi:stress response protein YsnF
MIQPEQSCAGKVAGEPGVAVVMPEIEESIDISKRVVETGVVRISKHVEEVHRTVHPTLHEQRTHIDRVPVNRVVKTAPQVRMEGDITIIPVVEEVMVKLLLLKEELHVRTETIEKDVKPQEVTLRREHVEVQREASQSPDKKT